MQKDIRKHHGSRRGLGRIGLLRSATLLIAAIQFVPCIAQGLTPSDYQFADPDADVGAQFGYSVSLNGNYLLVGSPAAKTGGTAGGAVYVYKNTLGTWTLQTRLTATPLAGNASFGRCIALSDDWAVMGAPYETSASSYAGAAYVFDANSWSQTARLVGSDLVYESTFGCSISTHGDRVLVGALGRNVGGSGSNFWSGRAYIYDYNSASSTWSETKIYNPYQDPDDYFGTCVELRGGVAAISSSHGPSHPSPRNGEATPFRFSGSSWTSDGYVVPTSAPVGGDSYGGANALSTDGQTLFVGARLAALGGNQGQVFVFDHDGSAWAQSQMLTAPAPVAGDLFGYSLSSEDDLLLVGAPRRDTAFADRGSALLYVNSSGTWTFAEELVSTTSALSVGFAISDNSIDVTKEWGVVGAYGEGVNPGTVHLYKLDRQAPTVSIDSIANPTAATFHPGLALSFSEAVYGLELSDFDCTGCSVSNLQGSGDSYTVDLTLDSEGAVALSLPVGSVSDNVGNPSNASNTVVSLRDTISPTSSANAAAIQVGGPITGTYSAGDAGSGVASVVLYVKEPGGAWSSAGAVTGGTWSHTPSQAGDAADGLYRFATVATDNATNAEAAPSGADAGDATVLHNDTANSSFAVVYTADGTAQFPMTATGVMEIALAGVTSPVTVTLGRTTGDVAPAGFMAGRLIDESLAISGNLSGATATITWNFDPASDDAPGFTATLDTVFQFSGSTPTGQYPVTPVGTTIVIPGVTSFSDWYAGSNNATVGDWTLLED